MSESKFFTNKEDNSLLKRFIGVFDNLTINEFDALVGYFRSSGYFKLRPYLQNVPKIRILVGINVDEIISKYHAQGVLFSKDAEKTRDEFLNDLQRDIQESPYERDVEEGILQFIQDIIDEKLEIRAHPTKRLHAKIYIFKPENWNTYNVGEVITGSSNLTEAGLGAVDATKNYEFNVLLRDYNDVKFASDEFNELWAESISILPVDIQGIQSKTYLRSDVTARQIYYKFLIEYFGKSVEFDPNSVSDLPQGFKRLNYQVDAVEQGYRLMMKHNGAFLSDVVGTGKTVVATLIAKKFFYHNGFPDHLSRTLIVMPPALEENWKDTTSKFGLANVDFMTSGSLHKIGSRIEKYDLVIVDEAHKFRNNTSESYADLQKICKAPAGRILDDESRAQKKVLLLSATPLNNRPDDIRNQVMLFQDGKRTSLDVPNLTSYFNNKIKIWKEISKDDIQVAKPKIEKLYADIRDKIIAPLTIRRTRTDLKEHPMYKKDLDDQGIKFPEVQPPHKVLYELDFELEDLYDETLKLLYDKKSGFTFNRYRAIGFLKPDLKKKYKAADLASEQLANIMRILLAKRIDSSFYAFTNTLKRFMDATEAMIKMRDKNKIFIAPGLKGKVSEYIMNDQEDELDVLITELEKTDPTITVCTVTDFEDGFFPGLEHDLKILKDLYSRWSSIKTDPKLDKFIGNLKKIVKEKYNVEGKLVVFSESKETTSYLMKKLNEAGFSGIIDVDASNRNQRMPIVRSNFDANADDATKKNDYNVIITTEVLAEGVNLHRANVIVNYDTPWNSTRLMQRIGRINRIGSVADEVHIFNFYPTSKVEDQIELKKKAIFKLQAFHSALGEDSQIYSSDEEVDTFGLFETPPPEERDETLAYLMELRKFKEEFPAEYREIKKMPLRMRVAVKDDTLGSSTYCYLKNQTGSAFLLVDNNEILEASFVKMAGTLKSNMDKPSTHPLPIYHHDLISKAIAEFERKMADAPLEKITIDTNKGPQEKQAMSLLTTFVNAQFLDQEDIDLIRLGQQCIAEQTFSPMQRELAQLARNVKKTPVSPETAAESVLNILKKYPVHSVVLNKAHSEKKIKSASELTPKVILSQTY
jgi:superfamily II DNA or RNA helicase